MTPDKDFAQLVSENIFMYRPANKWQKSTIWGIPEVLEKFKIKRIDQVIDFLAMMGDSADNIPGIAGVGEKTAQKFSISSTSKNFGKIGWINSESLNSKVSKVLNDLKIGEVSKPIKSLNSLIFFKLVDKKLSKIDDIDTKEFKKRLIDQKKNELFNLYSRSHLSKLKNNSLIEYK